MKNKFGQGRISETNTLPGKMDFRYDCTRMLLFRASFPSVYGFLPGFLIKPVACYSLSPREEAYAVFAKYMKITEEGILVARERKICARDRDTYVHAHHAAVGLHDKLSGVVAAACEDT